MNELNETNPKCNIELNWDYKYIPEYESELSKEERDLFSSTLDEQHIFKGDRQANRLYSGDSLAAIWGLLPELRGKVNLVYIDPPLLADTDRDRKVRMKYSTQNVYVPHFNSFWPQNVYLSFIQEYLLSLRDFISDDGTICFHCDSRYSHHIRCIMDTVYGSENFRNEIIWRYAQSGNSNTKYARLHDTILVYSRSDKQFFNRSAADGANDVWDIPAVRQKSDEWTGFPTQKPEALLEKIIESYTRRSDLVLDCFVGSGTTAVAAMKLGRRFIGMDKDVRAIDITTNRLVKLAKNYGDLILYPDLDVYTMDAYLELEFDCAGRYGLLSPENKKIINDEYYEDLDENIENASSVIRSYAVDYDYDGKVFRPTYYDIPSVKDTVSPIFPLPEERAWVKVVASLI